MKSNDKEKRIHLKLELENAKAEQLPRLVFVLVIWLKLKKQEKFMSVGLVVIPKQPKLKTFQHMTTIGADLDSSVPQKYS